MTWIRIATTGELPDDEMMPIQLDFLNWFCIAATVATS